MTSWFHIMEQMGQSQSRRFVEFARWRHRGRSFCLRLQACLAMYNDARNVQKNNMLFRECKFLEALFCWKKIHGFDWRWPTTLQVFWATLYTDGRYYRSNDYAGRARRTRSKAADAIGALPGSFSIWPRVDVMCHDGVDSTGSYASRA